MPFVPPTFLSFLSSKIRLALNFLYPHDVFVPHIRMCTALAILALTVIVHVHIIFLQLIRQTNCDVDCTV